MSYISVSELAVKLKERPEAILVVDVRQDDYVDGCILGSLHVPFDQFPEPAMTAIRSKISSDTKMIVTHCHYSQNRGPKAAQIIASTIDRVPAACLQGGWTAWFAQMRKSKLTVLF
jgi:rhodanese-related sulfurtransferase